MSAFYPPIFQKYSSFSIAKKEDEEIFFLFCEIEEIYEAFGDNHPPPWENKKKKIFLYCLRWE